MLRRHTLPFTLIASAIAVTVVATVSLSAQNQRRAQQPARDTPAQRTTTIAAGKGRISGRVVAADTSRPVRRARVFITATELPGGRGILTDDAGLFDFSELPQGRYTVTVSKAGFVNLSYGQRRPLQSGTPLQLGDGQELTGVNFTLPRGSVIAGHLYDESGDALPGATVRVLRYEYAQGNRQLVPVGTADTDDQGAYRVWGLNPGDYYVTAVTRTFDVGGRIGVGGPGGPGGPGAAAAAGAPGGGRGGPFGGQLGGRGAGDAVGQVLQSRGLATADVTEPVSYAPTFYPGVPSSNEARPVTVGLGAEALNVNFALLLVRTARLSGRVTSTDGSSTGGGNVTLMAEGLQGRGPGMTFGARVTGDGSFSVGNIPPGRYILRARGGSPDTPQFAEQPITVGDGDLQNLVVLLAPGATISGSVTFEATQSQGVPDANQIRIVAPTIDFAGPGPNPVARVDRQGTFTLEGVSSGQHWIRSQGGLRGWALKSVTIEGRDVIDTPLDVKSGQTLAGVRLVFTDRLSEVNGTLADNQQNAVTDYTVVAFPTESSLWRPQARQIMTARPDQNGNYQIRGLPPGDYWLAPIDPAEQGEWFESAFLEAHRASATRLSLGEGDIKTQNFTLSAP